MPVRVLTPNGESLEVDAEEAQQGFADGRYLMPTGRVKITRADSEIGSIDVSELGRALESGFRLVDDDEAGAIKIRAEEQDTASSLQGLAEAGLGGLSLGLSTELLTETGLVDPERAQARAEGLGALGLVTEVAGGLVPLAFTGGTGALGALARATPTAIAARGAAGAGRAAGRALGAGSRLVPAGVAGSLEGAVGTVGAEIHQSALGDIDLAADRLGSAGLMGLALGGGLAVPLARLGGRGKAIADDFALDRAPSSEAVAEIVGRDVGTGTISEAVARKIAKANGIADDVTERVVGYLRTPEDVEDLAQLLADRGRAAETEIASKMTPIFEETQAGVRKVREVLGKRAKLSQVERLLPEDPARLAVARQSLVDEMDAIDGHFANALEVNPRQFGASAGSIEQARAAVQAARDEIAAELATKARGAGGRWTPKDARKVVAATHSALDGLKQELRLIRTQVRRAEQFGHPGASPALRIIENAYDGLVAKLSDGKVLGRAGEAQADINTRVARAIAATEDLGKTAARRLISGEGVDTGDLLSALRQSTRFSGATKTERLQHALAEQIEAMQAVRRHYDLSPEDGAVIDTALDAGRRLELSLAENEARVQKLSDVDLLRRFETGDSPSNLQGGAGRVAADAASSLLTRATAGGLIGGVPGAVLGAASGAVRAATNLAASPYTALTGYVRYARLLAKIHEHSGGAGAKLAQMVQRFASKITTPATPAKAARRGPVTSRAAGQLSRKEQDERAHEVREHVQMLARDPTRIEDELRPVFASIERVAPGLAASLARKSAVAAQYLASKAPRVYSPPGWTGEPMIDPVEQARFVAAVETVLDPEAALARLADGTFTKDHADALREVYPDAYRELESVVLGALADAEAEGTPTDLQTRLQAGVFLNMPTDATLGPLGMKLQAAWGPSEAPVQGEQARPLPGGRASALAIKPASRLATATSRMESGEAPA